jgi:hypothetical protein
MIAMLLAVSTSAKPQQVTVCQILENLRMYDGKVVAIQGVNLNLKGTQEVLGVIEVMNPKGPHCQAPITGDDPRLLKPGDPPVNEIDVASLSVGHWPDPQVYRWWQQGYDISATIVGRIEVRSAGSRYGIGHREAYPAQITIAQIKDVKRSVEKGPKRKPEIILHIEL